MKRLSRFALLLLLLSQTGSVVIATPPYDTVTTYYTDETMTVVNGRKWEMCSGTWYTGTQDGYIDYWYGESCDNQSLNCMITEDKYMCANNCGDGIDNDGDGNSDISDPGCH